MKPTGQHLAEAAIELGICARDLPALAYAVELECMCSARHRAALEHIAARIGLSKDAAREILDQVDTRTAMLARAHRLLKALIPHAPIVTALDGVDAALRKDDR